MQQQESENQENQELYQQGEDDLVQYYIELLQGQVRKGLNLLNWLIEQQPNFSQQYNTVQLQKQYFKDNMPLFLRHVVRRNKLKTKKDYSDFIFDISEPFQENQKFPLPLLEPLQPKPKKATNTTPTTNPSVNPSKSPVTNPAIKNPVISPVTQNPVTKNPNTNPVIKNPVINPVTKNPTTNPVIKNPIINPVTKNPTTNPVIKNPVINPAIKNPTQNPVLEHPKNVGQNPNTYERPTTNPTPMPLPNAYPGQNFPQKQYIPKQNVPRENQQIKKQTVHYSGSMIRQQHNKSNQQPKQPEHREQKRRKDILTKLSECFDMPEKRHKFIAEVKSELFD